jgi:hypothetical protein
MYLWQAVEAKSKIINKTGNGKACMAIPISQNNEIVGLISIRPKNTIAIEELDDKSVLSHEQAKDMDEIVAVFHNAVKAINNPSVQTHSPQFEKLHGENMDEESKVGMLFASLMLDNVRNTLSSLDSQAIAEIKSYRYIS